jgi:replicative DNA helicase
MAKNRKVEENQNLNIIPADVRPPAAPDIEAAVLGACMIEKYAITKVIDILQPESFYIPAHSKIYKAMLDLFSANLPIDTVTLYEELRKSLLIEEVGGAVYLSKLSQNISSAANVEYHSKIVKEKQLMRGIIQSAHRMASKAYEDSEDAFEIIEEAEKAIFDLTQFNSKKAVHMKAAVDKALSGIKEGKSSEFKTGIYDLDNKLLISRGELIVIAARPAMGKSAFLYDIFNNYTGTVLNGKRNPVGLFSLEMGAEQIAVRGVSKESGYSFRQIYTGHFSEEGRLKIASAASKVMSKDIYIDDTPSISIMELRSKARRMKLEYGIKMIGVDYIQLMQAKGYEKNREREISVISQGLKKLAKELDIPVIALAQLNRAVESRSDKRPGLADLRESGAIEADADAILFLLRPEYYGIQKLESGEDTEGKAVIIIAKQRNGVTGDVITGFKKQTATFYNLTTRQESEQQAEMFDKRYETEKEDII